MSTEVINSLYLISFGFILAIIALIAVELLIMFKKQNEAEISQVKAVEEPKEDPEVTKKKALDALNKSMEEEYNQWFSDFTKTNDRAPTIIERSDFMNSLTSTYIAEDADKNIKDPVV